MCFVRLLWGQVRVSGAACLALHALLFGVHRAAPACPPRSVIPWFGPGSFHGAYGTHAPFILESWSGRVEATKRIRRGTHKRLRLRSCCFRELTAFVRTGRIVAKADAEFAAITFDSLLRQTSGNIRIFGCLMFA